MCPHAQSQTQGTPDIGRMELNRSKKCITLANLCDERLNQSMESVFLSKHQSSLLD